MKSGKLLAILAAVVTVFCGSIFAQTNVNEEQGIKPHDAVHGGDLDSVSLTSGSLLLHIPLVSFPQRGNLDLTFSVFSNTKQWTLVSWCNPSTDPCILTFRWQPLPRGGLLPLYG
jgi:hypothetical protein